MVAIDSYLSLIIHNSTYSVPSSALDYSAHVWSRPHSVANCYMNRHHPIDRRDALLHVAICLFQWKSCSIWFLFKESSCNGQFCCDTSSSSSSSAWPFAHSPPQAHFAPIQLPIAMVRMEPFENSLWVTPILTGVYAYSCSLIYRARNAIALSK